MPYLHWEYALASAQIRYLLGTIAGDVQRPDLNKHLTPLDINHLPCTTDEKIVRKYVTKSQPLHSRRELHSSFHQGLSDSMMGDVAQVLDIYAREKLPADIRGPPMLMVDQLWMWMLEGGLLSSKYARQSRS